VDAGPSYTTKRQEAVSSMLELAKAFPPLMEIAGDLLVQNMDWPGAQQISQRLKKSLPPNVAEEEDDSKIQVPPQVQAQMRAMMQQHEALTTEVERLTELVRTKKMELDSRERIAALQADAAIVQTGLAHSSRENIVQLQEELKQLRLRISDMSEPLAVEPDGEENDMAMGTGEINE
jgi:hypothetical protein